jgi:hypothetical protein
MYPLEFGKSLRIFVLLLPYQPLSFVRINELLAALNRT